MFPAQREASFLRLQPAVDLSRDGSLGGFIFIFFFHGEEFFVTSSTLFSLSLSLSLASIIFESLVLASHGEWREHEEHEQKHDMMAWLTVK